MLKLRVSGYVFSTLCCCFMFLTGAQNTDPSEVHALLAVKSCLIDPMTHLSKWNDGDPCISNWTGVFCFDAVGTDGYLHVQELQLMNMNLSGSLAPEIGNLSQLKVLDFMWNELTGAIPKEIGYIVPLKLLLLNGNKLSGSLPDELGNLHDLNRLQVDENNISGPIPKSFANLVSVKHLHLNNNSLSGQIPSELSRLSKLLHLLLDNNNLSGNLPSELYNLPALRILQLDNNNFQGSEIPVAFGNLSTLVKLSLRNCSLGGPVPDLGNIRNLCYLDLSWNLLSGPIPNRLSANMTTIDLSNNQLDGSIPESFSDFAFIQKLSLQNNSLSGSVPTKTWQNISFGSNATLTIDLRNNQLSNVSGNLNPPANVTLWLAGNPICKNASIQNMGLFCGPNTGGSGQRESLQNPTTRCDSRTCPMDFENVPGSPGLCFCAAPLRIGYRLKSPSFSYFPPYSQYFEEYLTSSLSLDLHEISIDSFAWEAGRLRMYLKIYPSFSKGDHTFNTSEVMRIRKKFTTWDFRQNDLFGPYELLNFTLLDPYASMNVVKPRMGISRAILAAIIVGSIAFILMVTLVILLFSRNLRPRQNLSRKNLSSTIGMKIDGVKEFTFKEMTLATDNFCISTQVGRGGYGRVYKGILSDNSVVAVKRAEEGSLQGQKEFLTEIELLSRLHHRNLVSLVGYCDEEGEQMLIYEFMPNGTLRDWLSDKTEKNLNFGERLQIALGSAKGILYLHTEANPPIFHRDIKASNILLDAKLTAKVSDFGLSRLAPLLDDEGDIPKYVSTVVKGTPGYLDPEYFLTHKLTDKSDVYSLGVVFLELLTGKHPISHGKNIVREVKMAYRLSTVFSFIDSRMGSYPSECVEKFVVLALSCCHDKPEKRPSMLDVVRELENISRMMPEESRIFSEFSPTTTTSNNTGPSSSSSTSFLQHDPFTTPSGISGSDLVSGVTPSIIPR